MALHALLEEERSFEIGQLLLTFEVLMVMGITNEGLIRTIENPNAELAVIIVGSLLDRNMVGPQVRFANIEGKWAYSVGKAGEATKWYALQDMPQQYPEVDCQTLHARLDEMTKRHFSENFQ